MPDKKRLPGFYFRGPATWFNDPRFLALTRGQASGFYFAALGWSKDQQTGGYVPDGVLSMLARNVKASARLDRAELVRVGLFEANSEGIRVIDYEIWQESDEEIEARRAKAKRAANTRWHGKTGNADAPSNAPGMLDAMHRIGKDSKEDSLTPTPSSTTEPERNAEGQTFAEFAASQGVPEMLKKLDDHTRPPYASEPF